MSPELSQIGCGFADASFGSQAVFRRCLEALAQPGTIVEIPADAHVPRGLQPAASALLLALLDQDTRLWLTPDLRNGSAQTFLRFHTGCVPVEDSAAADFALVQVGRDFPPLDRFERGSENYPDRSATLVVQTGSLMDDGGWRLSGPGIRDRARLAVGGLDDRFVSQWAHNGALFPCGIDLLITCGSRLVGLPRSTRIER